MSVHRVRWILLLASLWFAVAPVALAGEGQDDFTIRIAIDKTMVSPGDAISVTGSGATADVTVNVLIVPDPTSGANDLTSVEVTPNTDGSFSASVTVPDATETGRYAVRAEQPTGNGALVDQYYWVGICVNECTGESFGAMRPDTGGSFATGTVASLILSTLLVGALTIQGVRRAQADQS
jgi:hypothetical protein